MHDKSIVVCIGICKYTEKFCKETHQIDKHWLLLGIITVKGWGKDIFTFYFSNFILLTYIQKELIFI